MCSTGIQEIVNKCVTESVKTLAKKHGFDVDEALASLDIGNMANKAAKGKKEKKEPKESKESKESKDPKEPKEPKAKKEKTKRAPTGYMLYSAEHRPAVTKELTEALPEGEKLRPQLVISRLGANWKAEEQSVKDEWNGKAKSAAAQVASDGEDAEK